MASDKQIAANRANALLSTGPKTPEGKSYSARNATRHGLLANCVVLRGESRDGFMEALDEYAAYFGPLNEVEFGIMEQMLVAAWRLRRAWAIETNMFDTNPCGRRSNTPMDEIGTAFSELATQPKLSLLHRYEARLDRMEMRAFSKLAALRKLALPNEANKSNVFSPGEEPKANDPAA